MIVLLVGVLAMQQQRLLGIDLWADETDEKAPASYTLEDLKNIYPEVTSFTVRNDSIFVYKAGKQLGWAYNTSPVSDSIFGFASSVPLLIGFTNTDTLVGITLLENYESPDFVADIINTGFVDLWNKLHISEITKTDVDAVSGATMTSTAIIKTLKHSTGTLLNSSVSLSDKQDVWSILEMVLGYVLLFLALLQFFLPIKMKKIRTVSQIMVVVVLGFWSGTFLSVLSFYNWAIHGIDISAKLFVFIILVLSIVLPLFTNKSFYCSYMCPFGASQELLGKVNKRKIQIPPKLKEFLSTLREKVFGTIMLLLFTGASFDLTNIEPFSAFLFRTASVPVIVLATAFLLLSIFIPRPWCKYVCPAGYLFETIRKPVKK